MHAGETKPGTDITNDLENHIGDRVTIMAGNMEVTGDLIVVRDTDNKITSAGIPGSIWPLYHIEHIFFLRKKRA